MSNKTSKHPKMHKVLVKISGKEPFNFETEISSEQKDGVIVSDFDVNMLPWNRSGLGQTSTKSSVVNKFKNKHSIGYGNFMNVATNTDKKVANKE